VDGNHSSKLVFPCNPSNKYWTQEAGVSADAGGSKHFQQLSEQRQFGTDDSLDHAIDTNALCMPLIHPS
jgi:hypothetical protein